MLVRNFDSKRFLEEIVDYQIILFMFFQGIAYGIFSRWDGNIKAISTFTLYLVICILRLFGLRFRFYARCLTCRIQTYAGQFSKQQLETRCKNNVAGRRTQHSPHKLTKIYAIIQEIDKQQSFSSKDIFMLMVKLDKGQNFKIIHEI